MPSFSHTPPCPVVLQLFVCLCNIRVACVKSVFHIICSQHFQPTPSCFLIDLSTVPGTRQAFNFILRWFTHTGSFYIRKSFFLLFQHMLLPQFSLSLRLDISNAVPVPCIQSWRLKSSTSANLSKAFGAASYL